MSEIQPAVNEIQADGSSTSSKPEDRFDKRYLVCAGLIIALAAFLRFLLIAHYEVWLDEAYCFIVARKPILDIFRDLRSDNGPPLYYILLHYWMMLFGDGPTALRSLSAVLSTASVAVILFWRTPWFGRMARLVAGFAFAITPLAIYYGQEARMYALALFFVTLSMVFLERVLRLGGVRNWAPLAVTTALALYSSYIAIFLIPLGYIVIAIRYLYDNDQAAAQRTATGLVAAHVAAALLFAPWLPTFFRQPSAAATQWMGPYWQAANKPMLPLQSLSIMTVGGAYYPEFIRQLGQGPRRTEAMREEIRAGRETRILPRILTPVPPVVPLIITLALAAAAFLFALRRGEGAFPYRAFLIGWVALALFVPFFFSYFRPMYFAGRYELTGIPAFAAIFGVGVSRWPKGARVAAFAVAALLFAYTWGYVQCYPSAGMNIERAKILSDIAPKGAVPVCEVFEYATMYYYMGERRDELQFMTFPRDTYHHAAWIDYDKWLVPPQEWTEPRNQLLREAGDTWQEAIRKAGPGGRVIFVRTPNDNGGGWIKAMDGAIASALGEAAVPDTGQMDYEPAISRPDKGLLALDVKR